MDRLQEVLSTSRHHRRKNPPAMKFVYSEEFILELVEATRGAMEEPGADPAAIYGLVAGTVGKDVDSVDPRIDGALLQRIHPDAIVDAAKRETVLHELLSRVHPPPLQAEDGYAGIPLQQLLDRGATPDLQDATGNSVLHLLVVRIAKEKAFPDLEPEMAMHVADSDCLYRDEQRIEYLDSVGMALLRAGWSLDLPNGKGRTARRLLQLSHHIAEAKREAVQQGLEQALEVAGAMERSSQQQGRVGPDTAGASDAEKLRQQVQRQLERIDRMQAVIARLQHLAPAPA